VLKPIVTALFSLITLIPVLSTANSNAKIFTNIDGQVNARLVITPTLNGKYFIHFSNFGHEFDNKTYLYNKSYKEEDGRKTYFYTMAGTSTINFRSLGKTMLIHGSTREYSEVTLAGENPFKMIFVSKADISTIRFVKAKYLRTQGLLESKIAVKKLVNKAVLDFHNKCHKKLSVKIHWTEFISHKQKTTPGMAHAYINSLTQICQSNIRYRKAVNNITAIEFRLSKNPGKDKLAKTNNTITVYIDALTPNVHHTSKSKMRDIL